ncbi:MAG TPA: hypothetical protein PKB10_12785, partial [Tepidisphaeraceae bacterium]|nr:hypothetical protein [Tepidisphaeraceae bacterium]
YFDGRVVTQVEGVTAINGSPPSGNRFLEGTVTVNVTDGRLTLTNGSGASNNKLSFIEVERVGDVQPPPQVVEWRSGPQLPGAIGEVAGGFIDNKLVVLGDGDSRTFAWNFGTNSWQTLATRPFRAKDQLSEIVNNRLYVFGGVTYTSSGQQASNRTQIYNPTNNTWSYGANIPHGVFAAQTAAIDGFIYLAGGVVQGNVTTNKLFRYNPANNSWTEQAPMPIGRNSAPAGTDGSRLFVFGGRDGG